jgi:hypothetical protein
MIDMNNDGKKMTNAIIFDSYEDWSFLVQKYVDESNLYMRMLYQYYIGKEIYVLCMEKIPLWSS